ncbi:lysophospholipid acyltransferase family protein [Thermoflexibacter ruber]|uniref:1-acyl-sn-glycerol-3-phosphate acyltransferase n=1 Tax=Thermoflexibacter ruber TaxID=1003 RepID=A0A1I2D6J4_9BACT|nr:lysophospholipid acyltransferase family protein [Thermoflexibacter ruber]SFE76157.1 1-acyl-sn-glycerol-3-phosphate acyltransferase [Thermoflexibacter ruber]
MWRKILGWLITPFYAIVFFFILCFFHPILWITHKLFGYQALKNSVDVLMHSLLNSLYLMGVQYTFVMPDNPFPLDRPMIIVSNHQSMFDIPIIGCLLKKHHPKFVAKQELARGIPSISYNIRNGGSVTIDRKDARQALTAIKEFAEYLNKNNYAGCIFPEGTRSRNGELKTFKSQGLLMLLRSMPTATVVPVAIDGAWKLMRYNAAPIPFGVHVKANILPAINREGKTNEQIIEEIESAIRETLGQELVEK